MKLSIICIISVLYGTRLIFSKVCDTESCNATAQTILNHMDDTVDPCDDFYKFACGKFLDETEIPENVSYVNTFSNLKKKVQEQLDDIMNEKSNPTDPRPFVMAKNLYMSCMNQSHIEERGLYPLYQIFEKLGGWPVLRGDKWIQTNWTELIYKFREIGFSTNYLINFNIAPDWKNSSQYITYLEDPILGLKQKYLLKGKKNKKVKAYFNYMVDVAKILGADNETAYNDFEESLEFEIKLANIMPTKSRNYLDHYNPMMVRNLTGQFPSIPWLEYLHKIFLITPKIRKDELLIVQSPIFFTKLEDLLKQTPVRVQANYLIWRATESSLKNLNRKMRDRQFNYFKIIDKKSRRKSRWDECINVVFDALPLSVSSLYVKKFFTKDTEGNSKEMVDNIKREFKNILQETIWMDDKTRRAALEKVDLMKIHIGYPDELDNVTKLEEHYKKMEIHSDYYFESKLNVTRFFTEYWHSKLREPFNKSDWRDHGKSFVVNAFFFPLGNSIQIPAGILQGAFFSSDRPKYMNYGAIGSIIGHEITHGFDDQGSQYDKDGNLVDWLQPSTKEIFKNLTRCIVYQYSNYTESQFGLNLNGIKTMSENIADNGGLKVAYRAYSKWAYQHEAEPKLPGLGKFTPRQMFWISGASAECTKFRNETLSDRVDSGSYSPSEFRVIGPLSNMPEFSQDFGCKPGTRMNSTNKCTVW